MNLEVLEVRKSYGPVRAVDRVSFRAEGGRIFGLLGPNGAGKSTTIRMIMNIIAPDEGRILFDGQPIRPEDKDRIGYLPEERGLYRKMEVAAALRYFASLKNRSRAATEQDIDRWLERFELGDWRRRRIEELSKGMSQKLQFIVAALHDPEILVLDEPFAGLDPVSTDTLKEVILELERRGKTILLSTHIMEQAEKMCREILIIDHGREVLSGAVESLKAGFGRNSVIIELDGDPEIVRSSGMVTNVLAYPRWVEADLAEGCTTDQLLAALVGKVSIKRFEVMAPSLHKIFVRQFAGGEARP
jgi:ABC-2 type transport system ATP-binding protein